MVELKMINNGLVIIFVDKLLSLPVSMRPQRVKGQILDLNPKRHIATDLKQVWVAYLQR